MQYKSVEIDQGLLSEELIHIRTHKWLILENVAHCYDFGMLFVDCSPYKKTIVDHCEKLEETLSDYIRNEFNEKMKQVKQEIGMVKGRLEEDAESIDDVMALLDYIDSMKM